MAYYYFNLIFLWIIVAILLMAALMKYADNLKILRSEKMLIVYMILFYCFVVAILSHFGLMKTFLSECSINELEVSEGIEMNRYTSISAKILFLSTNPYNNDPYSHSRKRFDLSLCTPPINTKKLHRQRLTIWHKGDMVYQISNDGDIICSLETCNRNVSTYNKIVVPASYCIPATVIFYFVLGGLSKN